MSIALVEQLNFEKNMPLDGGCKQQIAVAQPCTGSGAYPLGSYFIINIPRCGPDYVFDPMNSFLRFNASNSDGTGVLDWAHSVNSVISKLEVLHAGNVLETVDNYPQLSALLLDTQIDQSTRINGLNLTMGCGTTLNAPGLGAALAANGSNWYSITLLSGIVGSLARNYIPVNDLQGSIQIRITLAHWNQIGIWSTALAADSDAAISIQNIEFHANMIKLSPEVMAMIRSPEYTIYSETYTNFQQTMAAAAGSSQIEQLIPTRYSSLKTVFLTMRKTTSVLNATHGNLIPTTRSSFGIVDYCFRLGSEQIPPTRVRCTGFGFIEPFEALKVALHCGGNTIASMGILNAANYIVAAPSGADATSTNGGYFVIGQDFETYSGKSGQLLSGCSTLGRDLYFSANIGAMAAGAVFDYFLHYDIKLIIKDGVLTVHV